MAQANSAQSDQSLHCLTFYNERFLRSNKIKSKVEAKIILDIYHSLLRHKNSCVSANMLKKKMSLDRRNYFFFLFFLFFFFFFFFFFLQKITRWSLQFYENYRYFVEGRCCTVLYCIFTDTKTSRVACLKQG